MNEQSTTPRTGPGARLLLIIGIVLGILAIAWGALFLVDLSLASTTTTHESYDAAETVELVADGDVNIAVAEGDVEVDAIAYSGLSSPEYSARQQGDRLEIRHECSWRFGFLSHCGGSLDVTLPAETEVLVRTSNGDIVARGVAGSVDLHSSNGEISADDLGGSLVARSSNGDVEVTGVAGSVELHTSNGDVTVADSGGNTVVDTDNGRIEIEGVTGDVTAGTNNGRVEIAGVTGSVTARSDNGDITVTGDGEAVALTAETSNGGRTVEGPTDPDAERAVDIRTSNGDVAYLTR